MAHGLPGCLPPPDPCRPCLPLSWILMHGQPSIWGYSSPEAAADLEHWDAAPSKPVQWVICQFRLSNYSCFEPHKQEREEKAVILSDSAPCHWYVSLPPWVLTKLKWPQAYWQLDTMRSSHRNRVWIFWLRSRAHRETGEICQLVHFQLNLRQRPACSRGSILQLQEVYASQRFSVISL